MECLVKNRKADAQMGGVARSDKTSLSGQDSVGFPQEINEAARLAADDRDGSFCCYGAAMKVFKRVDRQETGRWLANRAENSHLPFRRPRAMPGLRRTRVPQIFAAVHSSVHNQVNPEPSLSNRNTFKRNRTAALAERRPPVPETPITNGVDFGG